MKKLTIKEFGDTNNIFEVLHKNDEFFEALAEKKVADTEEEYKNDLHNLGIYGVSKFQYNTDYDCCVHFNGNLDITDFLKNCKTLLNKWVGNIPEEVANFKVDKRVIKLIKEGLLENRIDIEGVRYGVALEYPYRNLNVKYKNILNELFKIYEHIKLCVELLNDGFLDEMSKAEVYLGDDYQRLKYADENKLLFDEEGYLI